MKAQQSNHSPLLNPLPTKYGGIQPNLSKPGIYNYVHSWIYYSPTHEAMLNKRLNAYKVQWYKRNKSLLKELSGGKNTNPVLKAFQMDAVLQLVVTLDKANCIDDLDPKGIALWIEQNKGNFHKVSDLKQQVQDILNKAKTKVEKDESMLKQLFTATKESILFIIGLSFMEKIMLMMGYSFGNVALAFGLAIITAALPYWIGGTEKWNEEVNDLKTFHPVVEAIKSTLLFLLPYAYMELSLGVTKHCVFYLVTNLVKTASKQIGKWKTSNTKKLLGDLVRQAVLGYVRGVFRDFLKTLGPTTTGSISAIIWLNVAIESSIIGELALDLTMS